MKVKVQKKTKIEKQDERMNKRSNKPRSLIAYIICKSHQIKEFHTSATRKFNIDDETYVIKGNCCYFKKINNVLEQVAFYVEGNPNPFNLKDMIENKGLNAEELDKYIDADIFNILIECQENDKSKYIFPLVAVIFATGIIQFILTVIGVL